MPVTSNDIANQAIMFMGGNQPLVIVAELVLDAYAQMQEI